MTVLSQTERVQFTADHPDWILEGETLHRTFSFADFSEAMGFVTRVALAAERAFHHPGLDIRWNLVTVSLTSHDVGGLTNRDVELAVRIDSLAS